MGNLMKSKPKLLGNLWVLPEHFPEVICCYIRFSESCKDCISAKFIFGFYYRLNKF